MTLFRISSGFRRSFFISHGCLRGGERCVYYVCAHARSACACGRVFVK